MVGLPASAFRFEIQRLRFNAFIETRLLLNGVGAHFTALRPMATLSSWCWLPTSLPRSMRTNSSSFSVGIGSMVFRSHTIAPESKRAVCSGGLMRAGRPNPPLNSDPACIAFRPLSTSRYLGFVQRLGAGGAG